MCLRFSNVFATLPIPTCSRVFRFYRSSIASIVSYYTRATVLISQNDDRGDDKDDGDNTDYKDNNREL